MKLSAVSFQPSAISKQRVAQTCPRTARLRRPHPEAMQTIPRLPKAGSGVVELDAHLAAHPISFR